MAAFSTGDQLPGEGEALRDSQRLLPTHRPEMDVAAGQRQAVGLANGLAAHDLDPKAKGLGHAADHGELLPVLLPEDRHMGPRGEEELRNDRRHAPEVPGSVLATERLGDPLDVDPHGRPIGIEFLGLRRPDDVDTGLAAGGEVVLHDPGIALEVLRIIELGRVHEDRHDDAIRVRASGLDEREMARVERTHRRHEADAPSGGTLGVRPRLEFGSGGDDLHVVLLEARFDRYRYECSSSGNLRFTTSST